MKRLMSSVTSFALLCILTTLPVLTQTRTNSGEQRIDTSRKTSSTGFDVASFNRMFTHHTAQVNGVRLHYVRGGTGLPVVLQKLTEDKRAPSIGSGYAATSKI